MVMVVAHPMVVSHHMVVAVASNLTEVAVVPNLTEVVRVDMANHKVLTDFVVKEEVTANNRTGAEAVPHLRATVEITPTLSLWETSVTVTREVLKKC